MMNDILQMTWRMVRILIPLVIGIIISTIIQRRKIKKEVYDMLKDQGINPANLKETLKRRSDSGNKNRPKGIIRRFLDIELWSYYRNGYRHYAGHTHSVWSDIRPKTITVTIRDLLAAIGYTVLLVVIFALGYGVYSFLGSLASGMK